MNLREAQAPAGSPVRSGAAVPQARVPVIPETAPFTPEQRAWLNGFIAGILSRGSVDGLARPAAAEPARADAALRPVTILFGSQTGTAEGLAKRAAGLAGARGFAPTVLDMGRTPVGRLAQEQNLLVITSTYGEGEPPDNAKALHAALKAADAPRLGGLRYSVLGLGDTNYPGFCQCAKDFDARLEALGAKRVAARVDCDVEYDQGFAGWLETALTGLHHDSAPAEAPGAEPGAPDLAATGHPQIPAGARAGGTAAGPEGSNGLGLSDRSGASAGLAPSVEASARGNPSAWQAGAPGVSAGLAFPADGSALTGVPAKAGLAPGGGDGARSAPGALSRTGGERYSRAHPYPALLLASRKLNGEGSAKHVQHVEFSLGDSGLAYEPGDALGVWPRNGPELVAEILQRLRCDGEEEIRLPDGAPAPLRKALAERFDLGRPTAELAARLGAPPEDRDTPFHVGDILRLRPEGRLAPEEFIRLLRPLAPRLYSISSSPRAHPGAVHLTVGVVRYDAHGRTRQGVCSTFLAERARAGETRPGIFVHRNPGFRLPESPEAPAICVGPGTGIAPFRAFLEERRATGVKGKTWLFFGDQRVGADFLYREELAGFEADGTLARLDTAFSRDQERKIYVQHRMRERERELYAWLQEGAYFYVCGDAARMARDVDAALREVVASAAGKTAAEAEEYVEALRASKRYRRDVY